MDEDDNIFEMNDYASHEDALELGDLFGVVESYNE